MGVFGESDIELGQAGYSVSHPLSIDVQRHVRHPNLFIGPREATCYAIALLAFGSGVAIDQVNTSRARNAVAAAEAAAARAEAEQSAAEQKIADDVRSGRAVSFETGIFGFVYDSNSQLCLANPVVSGRYLIAVGRTNGDDPNSMQVLAVGVIDETDAQGPHDLMTAILDWDPDKGAYVARDTAYQGLAVGAGMTENPSQKC